MASVWHLSLFNKAGLINKTAWCQTTCDDRGKNGTNTTAGTEGEQGIQGVDRLD